MNFRYSCMHSISYLQLPIHVLDCSGLQSYVPLFDPYVRSPVTQHSLFQGPKNKVLQHLALSS